MAISFSSFVELEDGRLLASGDNEGGKLGVGSTDGGVLGMREVRVEME